MKDYCFVTKGTRRGFVFISFWKIFQNEYLVEHCEKLSNIRLTALTWVQYIQDARGTSCLVLFPASNYMFKVNDRNTRARSETEMCSMLTIKTLVSLLLTLNIFYTLF